MAIRRFSSRTHQLDKSFLIQHLEGARSYKRIAGYFTSSLFEVAHEWLDEIPEVKIVCNVDIHPDDLKVAQLRESKMVGRWNEADIETEALLNRARYRRLDQFLANRGQVIRVAPDSICGFVHGKAGVIELTRTMALELGPRVRVNAICPGFILTPMQAAEYTEEMQRAFASKLPLDRLGRPEDVAALFAFLASDDAAFITGQCFVIDGGELAGGLASQL